MAQWVKIPSSIPEDANLIPGLTQWVSDAIGSGIAGSYGSNLTPSLGASLCYGCGPKKPLPPQKRILKHWLSVFSISMLLLRHSSHSNS